MIWIFIISYIFCASFFSTIPIMEGLDEREHFRYIRYIVDEGELPHPAGQILGEYHQPPLYYLLAASVAAILPPVSADEGPVLRNPYTSPPTPRAINYNTNYFLHSSRDSFPYLDSNINLNIYALRLFSIFLGVLGLIGAWNLFHILWKENQTKRLLAMTIFTFWPVAIAQSSVISNDALILPISTWVLIFTIRQYKTPSWKTSGLLGITMGAALLTKLSCIVLLAPVTIMMMARPKQWKYAIFISLIIFAVCGWWFIRNIHLLGEPTAMSAHHLTWAEVVFDTSEHWLTVAVARLPQIYMSAFAQINYALLLPAWIISIFNAIILIGFSGALIYSGLSVYRHRRIDMRLLMPVGLFVANIFSVMYYAGTTYYGAQGRFLLISLACSAIFIASGIDFWASLCRIPQKVRVILLTVPVVITALYLATATIPTAYVPLPFPESIAAPRHIFFAEHAELVGISPSILTAQRGETYAIDLHWRAAQAGEHQWQVYLHGIEDGNFIWQDSLPGSGHFTADNWQNGDAWTEQYMFQIPEDVSIGARYPILAGLYDPVTSQQIPSFDGLGNPVTPFIGELLIIE